ncbi:MAG: zinc-ribbon domain-containing protein [Candidatus Heimdallarchaeota archaeon]
MSDYCPFCGNPIEGNVTFCPNCGAHIDERSGSSSSTASTQPKIVTDMPVSGAPQQYTYSSQPTQTYQPVQPVYQAPPPPQEGNSDADSSLFLGIGGLLCVPVFMSIPAIIFGFKALQKPNKHVTAIIGIILGFIGLWPLGVFWIFW